MEGDGQLPTLHEISSAGAEGSSGKPVWRQRTSLHCVKRNIPGFRAPEKFLKLETTARLAWALRPILRRHGLCEPNHEWHRMDAGLRKLSSAGIRFVAIAGTELEPGARLLECAKTMKIGVNLTEEESKAFKARKELELAGACGGEWCVDV